VPRLGLEGYVVVRGAAAAARWTRVFCWGRRATAVSFVATAAAAAAATEKLHVPRDDLSRVALVALFVFPRASL
jgi:hypothetical protein